MFEFIRRLRRVCFVFSLCLCGSVAAFADCTEPDRDADLIVAIRDAKPFTFVEDGVRQGLAIDLWNRVARDLYIDLENALTDSEKRVLTEAQQQELRRSVAFVTCETIDEQEVAMRDGLVDVVISPFTITAERMRKYDFSQQYLSSGLALALPETGAIDFAHAAGTVLDTLFQPTVAQAIVLFLCFNLVMAFLIRRWMMERRDGGALGVQSLLEAVVRTVGLKGVGDAYPSAFSKILEIFMAIVGTALSATILGILTTAFLGSVGENKTVAPSSLTKMRIATLKCSTAQGYLFEQYETLAKEMSADDPLMPILDERLKWMACPEGASIEGPTEMSENTGLAGAVVLTRSWAEAVRLLAEEEVEAVLGDWIGLTYLSRTARYDGVIDVQDQVYRNEPYGWAVARKPEADKLRRAIDRALIAQMRDVAWRSKLERHLGAGSVSPN